MKNKVIAFSIICPAVILFSGTKATVKTEAQETGSSEAQETESAFEIKADRLEFFEDSKMAVADGNVEVSSGNIKIQGQHIEIFNMGEYVRSSETVKFSDSGNYLISEDMEYSIAADTGTFNEAKGYFYPYYFRSKDARKDAATYYLKRIRLTTCNLDKPHYWTSASKAVFKTDKSIEMSNATLLIGPVPVSYLPWYSVSLKERKDCWEIYPGYNTRDGITARIRYGFPLTQQSYSKIHLDLLASQGTGIGVEQNYFVKDEVKGSFYAYHIKEETTSTERWTIKSSHWHRLSPTWSAQTNINFMSDEFFNKYYFGETWNPRFSEVKSDIAFTKQTRNTISRISADRVDKSKPGSAGFYLHNFNAPKFEWTLMQLKPDFLPVYVGFNTFLTHSLNAPDGNWTMWASTSNFYITRQLNVLRNTTLSPRLGVIENWQDRSSQFSKNALFITRPYSAVSLRQRFTSFSNIEFTHNIQFRSRRNSSDIESEADDYGVDLNRLKSVFYISPANETYLRVSCGYNLRDFRTYSFPDPRMRFDEPLATELKISPGRKTEWYTKYEHMLEPSSPVSALTDFYYRPSESVSFGAGVFYHEIEPEKIQVKNMFSFWLTQGIHLDYHAITSVSGSDLNLIDNRITVYYDLHCWEAKLTMRKTAEFEEYFFNIGLKISGLERKKLYNTQQEKEFYPWRGFER